MRKWQFVIPLEDVNGLEIGCETCGSSTTISADEQESFESTCPACGQPLLGGGASAVARRFLTFLSTAREHSSKGPIGFRIIRK
jgi:ribosomal protein S27E